MEQGKKTRGRQKIAMQKIENEADRFATFSKRRKGFYKKASEFCWLSGSDIGIVLTSPTGKPFSFFNPSPESIADRFFGRVQFGGESSQAIDAYARGKIDELYGEIDKLEVQMEGLNVRSKDLADRIETAPLEKTWWETPVDEFDIEEVQSHQAFLEGLQSAAKAYFDALNNGGASTSSAIATHKEQPIFSPLMLPNAGNNVFQN